jgi:hypothetical protein
MTPSEALTNFSEQMKLMSGLLSKNAISYDEFVRQMRMHDFISKNHDKTEQRKLDFEVNGSIGRKMLGRGLTSLVVGSIILMVLAVCL